MEFKLTIDTQRPDAAQQAAQGNLWASCQHPDLWSPVVRIIRVTDKQVTRYDFVAAGPPEAQGPWSLDGVLMPLPLEVSVGPKGLDFQAAQGMSVTYDNAWSASPQPRYVPDASSPNTCLLHGEVPHAMVDALARNAFGIELEWPNKIKDYPEWIRPWTRGDHGDPSPEPGVSEGSQVTGITIKAPDSGDSAVLTKREQKLRAAFKTYRGPMWRGLPRLGGKGGFEDHAGIGNVDRAELERLQHMA